MKNHLLVAGATCGKSFLAEQLTKQGLTVLDTDGIVEKLTPTFWSVNDLKVPGRVKELINVQNDLIVANEILVAQPKLVVTISWGRVFMDRLFPLSKKKKPGFIFVARANSLEVTRISRDRGFALSTGLIGKWNNVAERHASNHFDHVIWLPESAYLSDVVVGTNKGWMLTSLGQSISQLSRTEALRMSVDEFSELKALKGGQNG